MTEEEKIEKHIDKSIENFNAIYKEYKREENPGIKARLRKVLMNGAFWIAKDFNELEKSLGEVQNELPIQNAKKSFVEMQKNQS